MPNVIVTSHQAFLTEEALSNIADTTLGNVEEFFRDKFSVNEVCYKCPQLKECKQDHNKKCF
jgi:D-lactate dehydrogenase